MTEGPPSAEPGPQAEQPTPTNRPTLGQLWWTSLLLGVVGFGGGISVLGIMETMAVTKRRWLTEAEFATTATIAQMLPGGAASNALASMGLRLQGFRGALIAYTGFVAPGAVLVTVLAWVYVRFGAVADAGAFLSGLNAAVVGVILAIAVRMSRTGVKRLWQMGIAGVALLLSLVGGAGSGEVAILGIGLGIAFDLSVKRARVLRGRRKWKPSPPVALPEEGTLLRPQALADKPEKPAEKPPDSTARAFAAPVVLAALAAALPEVVQALAELLSLAAVFFRTGLGAYGGGFAIIPTLHSQVVVHHLITERQFADAVAVGKLTPGPVLLMGTFIGYLKEGFAGALVATVAILAAPFALVVVLSAWLEKVRANRWVRAALRGLTPSVVGLMIAAALTLGYSIKTPVSVAIAAVVALTLLRFDRVNPVALLALGGAARVIYRLATGL